MLETFLRGPKAIIHGYNAAIINATFEDIADQSALVVFPTTAVTLEVASSSVADILTSGTGAWSIRVYGLDANYRFQTEDFNLNGQTVVSGTKTWVFVYGAEVLTYGTGLVNAGTIYVADAVVTWTNGVPTGGGALTKTFAAITIGHNSSHSGYFCVPANERYCLTYAQISNRAQIVDYHAKIIPFSSPQSRLVLGLVPATGPAVELNIPFGAVLLNQKDTITFQGTAQATGGVGSVMAVLTRMARTNA